jgi:hypothetical protein
MSVFIVKSISLKLFNNTYTFLSIALFLFHYITLYYIYDIIRVNQYLVGAIHIQSEVSLFNQNKHV